MKKILITTLLSSLVLAACYYKKDEDYTLTHNPFDSDYDGDSPFVMDETLFFIESEYIAEPFGPGYFIHHPMASHKFHVRQELFPMETPVYSIIIEDIDGDIETFSVFSQDFHNHAFELIYDSMSVGQEICANYSFYSNGTTGRSYDYCYTVEE